MGTTISATELGSYASWRFCSLCAWVRMHVKTLPFQGFPGIFSSIDRYNKQIVLNHFEREQRLPDWLKSLGDVTQWIKPPHWRQFKVLDEETGITVRGEADCIFRLADGSYTIVDYKTSKYTPGQRSMRRSYEAQLNTYAYIGERLGLSPVKRLALIYMEPQTHDDKANTPEMVDSRGFSMEFEATIVNVRLRPETLIPPLLRRAKALSEMPTPPQGLSDCRDCSALGSLMKALSPPQA